MLLLDKLKDKEQFSSLELSIVDYVLEHPKDVTDLTVEELAKVTYTSASSIVRLCKKLGVKGYAEFRIKIATEINSFLINEEKIEVDMPIRPNASVDEVAKTFLNLHQQTILDIYNNLDYRVLQEAADFLYKADFIDLRGSGPSLMIANDFGWKLAKIGLPVSFKPLVGFDTFIRVKQTKNPVAVVVSNYANSKLVADWMDSFKESDTKVIMVSSNKNSRLFKRADIKVLIQSNEKDRVTKLGSFASRDAATYVLDIIYALIYMKDYNLNVKNQYLHGEEVKKRERYLGSDKIFDN